MKKAMISTLAVCLLLAGCSNKHSEESKTSLASSTSSSTSSAVSSVVSESSASSVTSSRAPSEVPKSDFVANSEPSQDSFASVSPQEIAPIDNDSAKASQKAQGLYEVNGLIVVNKKHPLPYDYAPGVDPVAQSQVNVLIGDMINQGLAVGWTTSNFRSYDYQSQLYNNYVAANGQAEADRFSARPGYSEHQTGLAFDLTDPYGQLLTSPVEAQWLIDNSWKYGFIVRYLDGKEEITGYMPEPWHLRYVGDQAQAIAQSGLTLEEYLGVDGGDY